MMARRSPDDDPTLAKSHRIGWTRRFLPGVLLLLLVPALGVLGPLARTHLGDGETWAGVAAILQRICLVLGLGYLLGTTVDALMKRRLSSLELDAEDNLDARRLATRIDVIRRVWAVFISILVVAIALTAVPGVRSIGISLFASAGVAGIAVGLAARPMLGNLIAGLQIAFTQPIRLEDAVVVENEWGWVEEIGLFHVVIRLWDWRRLVLPISYFIEKPFQNWTRSSAAIIGTVFWDLDPTAPVKAMREKLQAIVKTTPLWDGNVVNLQVVEAEGPVIRLRALATARNSPRAWDLRCYIREEMIAWLQETHPGALPRYRVQGMGEPSAPSVRGKEFERDESLRQAARGEGGAGRPGAAVPDQAEVR